MAVELSDLIQQLQELVDANYKLREENRSLGNHNSNS